MQETRQMSDANAFKNCKLLAMSVFTASHVSIWWPVNTHKTKKSTVDY